MKFEGDIGKGEVVPFELPNKMERESITHFRGLVLDAISKIEAAQTPHSIKFQEAVADNRDSEVIEVPRELSDNTIKLLQLLDELITTSKRIPDSNKIGQLFIDAGLDNVNHSIAKISFEGELVPFQFMQPPNAHTLLQQFGINEIPYETKEAA